MNVRAVRSTVLLTAATAAALVLASCSADVPMKPAKNANDPACAEVTVRLPQTIDGLERRSTNAQATGAWGNPANVLLYCGIEPSGPTTDSCVTVNGVDWIMDESRAPLFRFEAYGRNPGVEVIVNSEGNVSGTNVITELSAAVSKLPQEHKCTSVLETLDTSALGSTAAADQPPTAGETAE